MLGRCKGSADIGFELVLRFFKRVFGRRDHTGAEQVDSARIAQPRDVSLVIGLDFGTAFSKVIIGEQRVRYAVPLGSADNGKSSYLIPSALCVLPNGFCRLGTDPKGGTLFDNLKLPLIDRDFSFEVRVCATTFIALLLKRTRSWFLENHGSTYADRAIKWLVNVGLPTDSFEDEELKDTYLSLVQDAWHISESEAEISFAKVEKFVEEGGLASHPVQEDADRRLPSDRFNAFPEFLAHLAGYVGTPRRREDLHVTIDVGGGTFDFTVFKVVRQQEDSDKISIFARVVEPLGVNKLVERRLTAIESEVANDFSPFDNLPSDAEFAARFSMTKSQLESFDGRFRKRIRKVVTGTLRYTKTDRYATAPQWFNPKDERYGERLPSFFCGGGTLSEFYGSFLNTYNHPNPPFALEALELPVPEDLEPRGIAPSEFARLAVAYGLAIDPLNMIDFQKTTEIEDMDAPRSHQSFKEKYIGSEQV